MGMEGMPMMKKNLQEIGLERRKKLASFIETKKAGLKNWWERMKNYAFAAPEAAQMGAEKVDTAVNETYDKYVGIPYTQAVEKGKTFVAEKKQQAETWINDKKELAGTLATVAGMAAEQGKEVVKEKIIGAKEKVKSGFGKMLEYGWGALVAAESKRQQLVSAAREKVNGWKAKQLENEIATNANIAETAIKNVEALKAKLDALRGVNSAVAA